MLVSQLKPFSPERFDACMNYLMRQHQRPLDQHDITKLHVMADFFHVLSTGQQMIGGELTPWRHGPVVREGYNRARCLGHRYDENGKSTHQGKLRVVRKSGSKFYYEPYGTCDDEDFSAREREALTRAWQEIIPKTFQEREDFFHSSQTYMGRVWAKAKEMNQSAIDWGDVIDAYENITGEDHSVSRLMINMWREHE